MASPEVTHRAPIVFFAVVQLTLAVIATDIDPIQCVYNYINVSYVPPDTVNAVHMRTRPDWPVILAYVDGLAGLFVGAFPSVNRRLFALAPGIVIVTLFMNRIRHIGILGCYDGDKYCCGAAYCPNATKTLSLPGCTDEGVIYWGDSMNYCPWPKWYTINSENCGSSLAQTPDITWCYTYGCNYDSTPSRYVLNRAWVLNAVFLLISMFRLSELKKDALHNKFNFIK